jgi:hypothetical protein
LAPGSGSWSSLSDKNAKENYAEVDGYTLLARLAAIPIRTWHYRAQEPSIRHLGPTAQDFHAAFGLGEDDKHISTVDADGVALAAIQALYRLTQEKDEQFQAHREQIEALQAELAVVKAQLHRSDEEQVAALRLQE